MQDQINQFLDYLEAEKGYSNNTLAAYQNDLNQFLVFCKMCLRINVRGVGKT